MNSFFFILEIYLVVFDVSFTEDKSIQKSLCFPCTSGNEVELFCSPVLLANTVTNLQNFLNTEWIIRSHDTEPRNDFSS